MRWLPGAAAMVRPAAAAAIFTVAAWHGGNGGPLPSYAYEISSNRQYVLGAVQSLDALAQSLSALDTTSTAPATAAASAAAASAAFGDVEFILRSYRLQDRLPLLALETTTEANRQCVQDLARSTTTTLLTIGEYFSISNDGRSKVMISDSYKVLPSHPIPWTGAYIGLLTLTFTFTPFLPPLRRTKSWTLSSKGWRPRGKTCKSFCSAPIEKAAGAVWKEETRTPPIRCTCFVPCLKNTCFYKNIPSSSSSQLPLHI